MSLPETIPPVLNPEFSIGAATALDTLQLVESAHIARCVQILNNAQRSGRIKYWSAASFEKRALVLVQWETLAMSRHHGRSMGDALAQAAQVALYGTYDPKVEL